MAEQDCYNRALLLLTRREHSQQELSLKLLAKGFESVEIKTAIEQLAQAGLQSDKRFAELYAESRMQKGYGPLRIQRELQQKGIVASEADLALEPYRTEWAKQIKRVREKYCRLHPQANRTKQQQFLYYRGFSPEQITCLFDAVEDSLE